MGTTFSQSDGEDYTDEEEYIPSLKEVLQIKTMLMTLLPQELVDIIVDEAECWLCATSEHDYGGQHPYKIEADSGTHFGIQRCCAITPEMSDMIPQPFFKIRRVRFILSSHDQGWGGEPGLEGEYEGSYSWFEAKIVHALPNKPGEETERPGEPYIMRDLDMGTQEWTETVKNPYANKGMDGTKDPHVLAGAGDSWTIQRNIRANDMYHEHAVVWTWGDELDTSNELARLDGEGIGQGAGFVEALKKDDRIAVMARARYSGWANFVKSVTIQVFYSI